METYVLKVDKKQRDSLVLRYKDEKKQLLTQIREIDSYLMQLGENVTNKNDQQLEIPSSKYQDYSSKWPYIRKTKFILENEQKFLTVREIIEIIIEIEPKLNFETIRKSVAGVISERIKRNRDLSRTWDDAGVSLIGLIDWFDENGEPNGLQDSSQTSLSITDNVTTNRRRTKFSESKDLKDIPVLGDKVAHMMRYSIKRAVPREVTEAVFKELTGESMDLKYAIRNKVKRGSLLLVKFNNSLRYTFSILPEWIDSEQKLKKEHWPLPKYLPNSVKNVEIVRQK